MCAVLKFQSNVIKFEFEFLIRTLQDSEMRKKNNKAKHTNMASKNDLCSYFNVVSEKKKKKDSAVSISEIIVSETSDVSQAEVDMAREQVKKQVMQRKSYQVVPEKVKIEVGRYAALNGTKAALKRYSKIYPKYDLKRTSVNSWKSKIKDKKENSLAKRSGRPNLLSDDLLKKTKDIIIGTRIAGTVISRRMVIAIGTGQLVIFVCFCFFLISFLVSFYTLYCTRYLQNFIVYSNYTLYT